MVNGLRLTGLRNLLAGAVVSADLVFGSSSGDIFAQDSFTRGLLGATTIGVLQTGARANDGTYVHDLSVAGKYSVYNHQGPYETKGMHINHITPGGFMAGNRNFRSNYYVYNTLQEAIDRGDASVGGNWNLAYVGINDSVLSGRLVVLNMPQHNNGELRVDFNPGSIIGGFYDGRGRSTIRDAFDVLSIGLEKGKLICCKPPNSTITLVQWSSGSSGSMGTGSVAVDVDDGRPSFRTGREVTNSHRRSAVPMSLRFMRDDGGCTEYFISDRGNYQRTR